MYPRQIVLITLYVRSLTVFTSNTSWFVNKKGVKKYRENRINVPSL